MALKIVPRWDVLINWYERAPNLPRLPKKWYSWMDESEEVPPVSYIHRANSLQWHEIEDLILRHDVTTVLECNHDGSSILDRYAFHGIKNRLLQLLDFLPRDLFDRHMKQGTRLLLLCA
jgi:hypothetical protein